MDAFAVSVCKGLGMHRVNYAHALVIALFFGVFQGLMPVIGWLVGSAFAVYVTAVDHWIAFALLAFVGGKMLWDAFHDEGEEEDETVTHKLDLRELFMLAIATSIDALAVGITFALLPDINVPLAVCLIGITTFLCSAAGLRVGNLFGLRYKAKAELAGGIILILIGLKILLEHLGVISF